MSSLGRILQVDVPGGSLIPWIVHIIVFFFGGGGGPTSTGNPYSMGPPFDSVQSCLISVAKNGRYSVTGSSIMVYKSTHIWGAPSCMVLMVLMAMDSGWFPTNPLNIGCFSLVVRGLTLLICSGISHQVNIVDSRFQWYFLIAMIVIITTIII